MTVILFPVAPVLHFTMPEQPLALKVALSALHKLVLLVLITGAAGLLPVLITIALLAPLSPQLLIQVALYVPAVLTLMLAVVAPVLHFKVPEQPVALKVALSALHKLVLLVLITGAAGLLPILITISFDFGLTPQIVSHNTE